MNELSANLDVAIARADVPSDCQQIVDRALKGRHVHIRDITIDRGRHVVVRDRF